MSIELISLPVTERRHETLTNVVVRNLFAFAKRAWRKRWIVTFVSPTGVGKTEAINFAERELQFPRLIVRCHAVTTRYSMLENMALKPGEIRRTSGSNYQSAHTLYGMALERYRSEPYLLMVDEADRLRSDCFEMLRDFHDDLRLPMLLVGNEVLNDKINRQHERLFRRIKARHEQRPLECAELSETLQFMGYKLGDEEFDFVWKLVGGSPGFAEAVLDNAQEIADSHGVKLNVDALAGAARYFPSLAKRM
jgi:DNA transposition AAA+ family ATPase